MLFRLRIGIVLFVALVVAFFLSIQPAQAQEPENGQQIFLPLLATRGSVSALEIPLCRFGVNGDIDGVDIAPMRIGWYVDYHGSLDAAEPNGVIYAPMIRLRQEGPDNYRYSIYFNWLPTTEAELKALIAAHPSAEWFIGNEPDRRFIQDDIEPHLYARAYHDLYHLIKAEDPTAKIIAGSIVQPTPLRIQYLDKVLASYRQQYGVAMPVDIWAIHNFILNEASCDHFNQFECWGAGIPPGLDAIEGMRVLVRQNDSLTLFKEQIVRFRQWLADNGYRGVPVYLSEYGVLMPNRFAPPDDYPPSRVNGFMNATFDYLLNEAKDPVLGDPTDDYRLIQKFSWYSFHDTQYNGYLFEPNPAPQTGYRRSEMGENFFAYVSAVQDEIDFSPVRVRSDPPAPIASGETVTVTLKATIANSGNLVRPRTVAVRFYDGDPNSGGRQIGQEQRVALAGCGEDAEVQVQWPNVAPGRYQVYVQVNSATSMRETNVDNNSRVHEFTVFTHGLYLPGVEKGAGQ